jgi:hypothetical protein
MKKMLSALKGDKNHDRRTFLPLISSVMLVAFGLRVTTAVAASGPPSDNSEAKAPAAESISGQPFSFAYSFGYARTLVATANGSCVPGYKGALLEGHLNEQGDVMRNASRWIAHVDAPGHINWAIRFGDKKAAGFMGDLTCRHDEIYAAIGTASNRGLIGKFVADSLKPVNAIAYTVTPALNEAFFEFEREPSLPFAVSLLQDRGNSVAFSIISQEMKMTLNKTYTLPAFATATRDKSSRQTRCRAFRAQDGSGYYLVITDVASTAGDQYNEVTRME